MRFDAYEDARIEMLEGINGFLRECEEKAVGGLLTEDVDAYGYSAFDGETLLEIEEWLDDYYREMYGRY